LRERRGRALLVRFPENRAADRAADSAGVRDPRQVLTRSARPGRAAGAPDFVEQPVDRAQDELVAVLLVRFQVFGVAIGTLEKTPHGALVDALVVLAIAQARQVERIKDLLAVLLDR